MDILPAIDLIDGKCVRLIQGRYDKQIIYEDDPVKQAQLFYSEGARRLHIVDLDGAKAGEPINTEAVRNIIAAVDLKVELGGGIRDEDSIRAMLDIGLDRLIVGTSAIRDFGWFSEMAGKFPHKLALGLDARGAKVSVSGWTQESPQQLWDFAAKAANLPLAAIVYTDIARDGMMTGPNFERTKALIDAVNRPVIAAGGVTKTADIIKLKDLGAAGVIIGRAIYEGKITVAEAIEAEKQA